jgi:predicted translin family RNA/ssDNA-binding protein
MSELIPSYATLVLGIRNPQERKIYPLSWHDMKRVQEVFFSVITGAVNLSDSGYTQEQVYQYILGRICDRIGEVLEMVVDGEPVDEKELSLQQVTELAILIYDMNFEGISKNVQSLLQKVDLMKKSVEKA